MLLRFLLLFLLAVSGELSAQIISQFTWDANPFTQAIIGPNATSTSTSATTSPGGVGGTNGLNPGLPKDDLEITIPNDGRFDVQGIEISYDYRREESAGTILTRGTNFRLGTASQLSVTFSVADGNGGSTSITSNNTTEVPTDGAFHRCVFRYDPNAGEAFLFFDGTQVWSHGLAPGRALVWNSNTDLKLGFGLDASGKNLSILDNFVVREIPMNSLPVVFAEFAAEAQTNHRVELRWQTASEWDNDYFAVQRQSSSDRWVTVQQIPGRGNSNEVLTYKTEDRVPQLGTYYYRLKQVDYDGTAAYSPIRSVLVKDVATGRPTLYPNPTSGLVWIGSSGPVEDLRVIDSSGRDQLHRVVIRYRNDGQSTVDLRSLPAGLYTLVYAGGVHRVVKR